LQATLGAGFPDRVVLIVVVRDQLMGATAAAGRMTPLPPERGKKYHPKDEEHPTATRQEGRPYYHQSSIGSPTVEGRNRDACRDLFTDWMATMIADPSITKA